MLWTHRTLISIITFSMSLGITNLAIGQNLDLGVMIGANLASLQNDNHQYQPGHLYGGFARISNHTKLSTILEIAHHTQRIQLGNKLLTTNTVNFPLLLRYDINKILFLIAGGQYAFVTKQPSDVDIEPLKGRQLDLSYGLGINMPMGFSSTLRFNDPLTRVGSSKHGLSRHLVQLSLEMDLVKLRH